MTLHGPHGPVSGPPSPTVSDGPDWYRDAIVYEVHIRAFQDSDGDGIGDFDGLTSRLDYLQDLGINTIWLLPFYPSPLRDDGYDIADYRGINGDYGDLRAFRRMLREAHRRGLRVITELVINHTSDAHAWFQRARRAEPGSRWRDFYVWSDTTDRYRDARVIFHDFESSNWTWDPVAGAYFWHRFYSHQPDLNYDNPEVHQAVLDTLDFWFGLGVDGLRLDAVPYLYERDGTHCENLPETHQFLRRLRRHVDGHFPGRMLLAEANQWPEDAVAYFGDEHERECHMAFHFPLMPRMFMAVQMEDRFPVVDILEQTPALPEGGQWAIFLRNHDELTLEMVSAEERDYMYRVYAHDPQMRVNAGIRRRLAPLLGNDRRKIELLNGLLLALPGTPVIYYGDEIGMGDNVYLGDRDAVRTPMQWAPERNAGFSSANPHKLYLPAIIDPEYHYEMVNVEVQEAHENSLYRWMRQILHLRGRHSVLGRGSLHMLLPDNPRIVAFVRSHEDQHVLVVANLAGSAQYAELDLADCAGTRPVELFGRTEFPPVGELPYLVTLGPYAFHWFALERQETDAPVQGAGTGPVPTVQVDGPWSEALEGSTRAAIEHLLPGHLARRRWFPGKGRAISATRIVDVVRLTPKGAAVPAYLAFVRVRFREGEPATYALPLAIVGGERAEALLAEMSHGVLAALHRPDGETRVLSEAMWEPSACRALLDRCRSRRPRSGAKGELVGSPTAAFRKVAGDLGELDAQVVRAEQSNTSVVFGDQAIMKLFRRLEPGVNPDLEMSRFLTAQEFPHVPRLLGALEYLTDRQPAMTVALIHEYVANEGDLWQHTLDALSRFYRETLYQHPAGTTAPPGHPLDHLDEAVPEVAVHANGAFYELCDLLGTRTAQLHRALATPTDDPAFGAEDLSALDQRSLHQSMRSAAARALTLLRRRLGDLPEEMVESAAAVLAHERELLDRFEPLRAGRLGGQRIRVHGDYHLGQVLFTGRDVVILDFEGEPLQSISERRLRRSPLRDVAGMLRSFHYATLVALRREEQRGLLAAGTEPAMRAATWARAWYGWAAGRFLGAYLREAADAAFLPADPASLRLLLDAFVLEKAVYELSYELGNRPDWCWIPLAGLVDSLATEGGAR